LNPAQFGNGMFRPWTYSTFPAYSVKSQASSFGSFNYSCHSVYMSCWIKKRLLSYLPGDKMSRGERTKGQNIHKSSVR